MEFRKMVLMNLFSGQQRRYRHREQTCGPGAGGGGGEGRVGQMERVAQKHAHYHILNNQQELAA